MRIHKNNTNDSEKGFTLVELMIATAVFSVVLLLCATAIVQVGRLFYKGTIINRTQTTARTAMDDISQSIQFGTSSTPFYRVGTQAFRGGTVVVNSYCFGSIRYSYAPSNLSLGSDTTTQSPHILWKDRYSGITCPPVDVTNSGLVGGVELLGSSMRLALIQPTAPLKMDGSVDTAGIWKVKIVVAYGADTDLFVPASNYQTCIGNKVGGQFCSVSTITTNVIKRLL